MLRRRTFCVFLVAFVLLWTGTALWLVPQVIEAAYAGRSVEIVNSLISGQAAHPLSHYQMLWKAIALRISVLLIAVGILGLGIVRFGPLLIAKGGRLLGMPSAIPVSRRDFILIALFFGLMTGFGEAVVAAVRQLIQPMPGWQYTWEVVWLAPLANGVSFAVLSIVLLLILGVLGRKTPPLQLTFLVALLGAYLLLRLLGIGLTPLAALLLGAGLTLTLMRLVLRAPTVLLGRTRKYVGIMVPLIGVLGVGQSVWSRPSQQDMGPVPEQLRPIPNVLLLVLDTVRAHSLSLHGYERSTSPFLEQLARIGTVFEYAIAPSSWTLPSHATLFTARHPHEHEATAEQPLDDTFPTLAEQLRNHGFETAGFVANLGWTQSATGIGRGFTVYQDHVFSLSMFATNSSILRTVHRWLRLSRWSPAWEMLANEAKSAPEISAAFLAWADQRDQPDRPFFAFLNYMEAHDPYVPHPELPGAFGTRYIRASRHGARNPAIRQPLIDLYDGEILYLDTELQSLFARMAERELLDNTLVIVTSDHGEEFAENQAEVAGHGVSLFMSSIRVPLVMVLPPHVPQGMRVAKPVSLRDIPATVLELVGINNTVFPGQSLSGYWASRPETHAAPRAPAYAQLNAKPWLPAWAPAHRGGITSVVLDDLHYIRSEDGLEQVYRYTSDPFEQHDLSASLGEATLGRLRGSLQAIHVDDTPSGAAR